MTVESTVEKLIAAFAVAFPSNQGILFKVDNPEQKYLFDIVVIGPLISPTPGVLHQVVSLVQQPALTTKVSLMQLRNC